jgi:hypothetical protein
MRGRHQGLPPAAQRILRSTSVLLKVDDFTLALAQCLCSVGASTSAERAAPTTRRPARGSVFSLICLGGRR